MLKAISTTCLRSAVVGCLVILTSATGTLAEDVAVDTDGNMGIGIVSPAFPLHVVRPDGPGSTTIAKFQRTSLNKATIVQFQNTALASTSNSVGFDYLLRDAASSKIVGRFVCSLVDTTGGSATAAMQFQVMNDGVTNQAMKIQGNRVSIGTNASTDLLRVLNATCNGATWNNACSRELKRGITPLDAETAAAALEDLKPVTYAYHAEPNDQRVGFVAEDAPQLVSMQDGKSLCAMDIVAVLTQVTKEQQNQIAALESELAGKDSQLTEVSSQLEEQGRRLAEQERLMQSLFERLESTVPTSTR